MRIKSFKTNHCSSILKLSLLSLIVTFSYCSYTIGDELKTSLGLNYFYGDYERDERTTVLHSALTINYKTFPWEAKLSLPYLKINGFGGIDGNGNIIGDGAGERRKDVGFGDVLAQLSYLLVPPIKDHFFKQSVLKFTGKIKFPTADENKGLGTGEYDYTLETQFIKQVDQFTPFATLGYTYVGKTSESILNNRYYANFGSVYRLNSQFNTGLMYTYKQASSDERNSDQKVISFFNWKIPQSAWSIDGYVMAGLTNATPDAGAGFSLSYRTRL